MIWNRCGRTHLGPIPDNNRLKITKGLVGCLTHRDNPHGSSARHVQFQRELDEMIQEEGYFSNPTVERLCEIVARLILQREQTQQRFMAQSGTLGSSSSSSTLGKHPRYPKSTDTANKHTKATDNEEIPICQGCGRFGHHRDDPCALHDHPDFNRSGDWVGSAAEKAIRAFCRRNQPNTPIPLRVKLFKNLRADGTKIPKASQQRPSTPPMDANTRRDHDDQSGGRGGTGGRGNRNPRSQGSRGKVTFDRSIYSGKGTQCLTDIVTHLSCNCGESDINSSYRQCLVSMRSSTTYFTALTLFDTGAYTSFCQ